MHSIDWCISSSQGQSEWDIKHYIFSIASFLNPGTCKVETPEVMEEMSLWFALGLECKSVVRTRP